MAKGKKKSAKTPLFNCGACIVDYCFCGTLCILFWIKTLSRQNELCR